VPQDCAKTPRIVQADCDAIETPLYMIVLAQKFTRLDMAQRSGHAQMHKQGTVFETQQQVFSPPLAGQQLFALQNEIELGRNRPAHPRFVHVDRKQPLAGNDHVQAAAGGFNFR